MQKERTVLLAITLIAVVLFLGGCVTQKPSLQDRFASGTDTGTDSNAPRGSTGRGDAGGQATQEQLGLGQLMDECLRDGSEALRDVCLTELAEEKKDDLPCERITLLPKSTCFAKVALAAKDDNYCGKITAQPPRDVCYRDVGIATKSAETCAKIEADIGSRDECYRNAAESNRESGTCSTIFDPTKRDACLIKVADLTNDNSFCDGVSTRLTSEGIQRDICILHGEDITGEQCASLSKEDARAECFTKATSTPTGEVDCGSFNDHESVENCRVWTAAYSGDTSECYELEAGKIGNCLNAVIDGNITLKTCTTITPSYLETRNSCYKKLALQELDESLCSNVAGTTQNRSLCVLSVAVAKLDPESCPSRTDLRDDCYSQIALETKDFSLCESVNTDRSYIKCYKDTALSLQTSEVCARSERTSFRLLPYTGRDYCYNDYAVAEEESSLCQKIGFSSLREECASIVKTCVDNDSICNEDACSYLNDSDCLRPGACTVDSDCEDGKFSTKDTCVNSVCKTEFITSCTSGDHYCPSQCTYEGDPNATGNTDSDCLKPCSLEGGAICGAGTTCPAKNTVPSIEEQCCEIHPEGGQTYCEPA